MKLTYYIIVSIVSSFSLLLSADNKIATEKNGKTMRFFPIGSILKGVHYTVYNQHNQMTSSVQSDMIKVLDENRIFGKLLKIKFLQAKNATWVHAFLLNATYSQRQQTVSTNKNFAVNYEDIQMFSQQGGLINLAKKYGTMAKRVITVYWRDKAQAPSILSGKGEFTMPQLKHKKYTDLFSTVQAEQGLHFIVPEHFLHYRRFISLYDQQITLHAGKFLKIWLYSKTEVAQQKQQQQSGFFARVKKLQAEEDIDLSIFVKEEKRKLKIKANVLSYDGATKKLLLQGDLLTIVVQEPKRQGIIKAQHKNAKVWIDLAGNMTFDQGHWVEKYSNTYEQ